MNIELKKFGNILVSRTAGREASLAYQPVLNTLKPKESITINFEGVTLGPSWADEFLTPIFKKYKARIKLVNT